MAYVIVERVTDPEAAARALTERGESGRAEQVRARGAGTFPMSDPAELGSDRERALAGLAMWRQQREVDGLRVYLRIDFDPDWSKQNFAAREALREVPALRERSAVAAVNAFGRAYYGRDARWDVPDHGDGRWPQVDGRNFADHAYLVANALGGLRLVDGAASPWYRLGVAARAGWTLDAPDPDRGLYVSAELWLAFALGRTLRRCGEGDLERLCEAFEVGSEGNS